MLVALCGATSRAGWDNRANWLSDAPLGDWHGVTTGEIGRVIELNLIENGLSGPIPSELATSPT